MSTMRSTAGVAVLNGRLYVVGGRDGTTCHRSCEMFNPHTNRWTNCATMNKRRGGVTVAALNGELSSVVSKIHCSFNHFLNMQGFFLHLVATIVQPVILPFVAQKLWRGCFHTINCTFSIIFFFFFVNLRYDPHTDTWTIIASLSSGKDAIGCSVLGNTIVAVGGFDGVQYLKTVEQYDPETNSWKVCAPVTYSRAGASVITIPNELESSNLNSAASSTSSTSTTV